MTIHFQSSAVDVANMAALVYYYNAEDNKLVSSFRKELFFSFGLTLMCFLAWNLTLVKWTWKHFGRLDLLEGSFCNYILWKFTLATLFDYGCQWRQLFVSSILSFMLHLYQCLQFGVFQLSHSFLAFSEPFAIKKVMFIGCDGFHIWNVLVSGLLRNFVLAIFFSRYH